MIIVAVTSDAVYAQSQKIEQMKKNRSEKFIFEINIEWGTIGNGVKRQIMGYDSQLMMVKIKSEKKGSVGVEHSHYHSQVTFFSRGKFEFTIGDE